ncbi:MAG TPA: PQQ-dependent sugar dehydrogenase [Pseudomonadales bacterium]
MNARLAFALACLSSAVIAQQPEPTPAFAGQTDAPPPAVRSSGFKIETITDKLTGPWALAFLPSGNFIVTERPGTMRVVTPDGQVSEPLANVPPVKRVAAEGLHDVVLDPEFETNRTIYFIYFAPPKGEEAAEWPITHFYEDVWTKSLAERRTLELGTERIGKARLSEDERSLEDVEVLYEPGVERRLVWAPDGTLFAIGADAFRFYDSELDGVEGRDFRDEPDVTRNFSGRVTRINRDGTIPKDNPWLGRATVSRETYAHGLKDPEGAAIHPETGALWVVDHGPQGGDEINIIKPGADYGWPNVTYGVQYDARQADGRTNVPVGFGLTEAPGVEQPIYYWVPSIAPSGMAFYAGELFPEWKNDLFVGAMAGRALVRLELDGERVVSEERLLQELDERIREVRSGPDGALYIFAGNKLMRIVPE